MGGIAATGCGSAATGAGGELALVEEVGIGIVGFVEGLRLALVRVLGAPKRDLRGLVVDGIESLQRLMRRQRTRPRALSGLRYIIVPCLMGESIVAGLGAIGGSPVVEMQRLVVFKRLMRGSAGEVLGFLLGEARILE